MPTPRARVGAAARTEPDAVRAVLAGEHPAELARRRKAWKAPPSHQGSDRGYTGLFHKTVLQADEGVDFDFLGPAKAK